MKNELPFTEIPLVLFETIVLIVFILFFIGIFFIKGTNGPNKYGSDPLQDSCFYVPRISKPGCFLIVGPVTVSLIVFLPMLFFQEGFKGGIRKIGKGVSEVLIGEEETDGKTEAR